jgi:hypothetical protein
VAPLLLMTASRQALLHLQALPITDTPSQASQRMKSSEDL